MKRVSGECMNRIARALLACAAVVAAGPALGSDALVEAADAGTGLEAYQFLEAGAVIDLSGGLAVALGYPASCVHERISGGRVVVGKDRSRVEGGSVERSQLDCGGRVQLSEAERQESGASAWRVGASQPPLILHDRAPLLLFPEEPEMVVIERTDMPAQSIRLQRPGRTLDLAARGIALEAGGIYVISAGPGRRTVEIDFDATVTGGPAVARFVRF